MFSKLKHYFEMPSQMVEHGILTESGALTLYVSTGLEGLYSPKIKFSV